MPLYLLLILAAIATLVVTIRYYLRQQEEQKKIRYTQILLNRFPDIQLATNCFKQLCSYSNGYFTHSKLTAWQQQFQPAFHEVKDISPWDIQLEQTEVKLFEDFIDAYNNAEEKRSTFNQELIQLDLQQYSQLFDNIGGISLDEHNERPSLKMKIVTWSLPARVAAKPLPWWGK